MREQVVAQTSCLLPQLHLQAGCLRYQLAVKKSVGTGEKRCKSWADPPYGPPYGAHAFAAIVPRSSRATEAETDGEIDR
ncbi:hypothetical protein AMJ85_02275 [candidate division BRC1 bacterium SM23_51]|nr:MAG: hypothetical protein AMJ85_02275 [candidate division BRC1 bacterium SM23_51]